MTCTCPHHYGPTGLEKYGTDSKCPVHGKPQPVIPSDEPRYVTAVCPRCQLVHTGRFECP